MAATRTGRTGGMARAKPAFPESGSPAAIKTGTTAAHTIKYLSVQPPCELAPGFCDHPFPVC